MMTIVNLAGKPLKASACGSCSGSSSDNNIRVPREIDPEALTSARSEVMAMPSEVNAA